MKDKQIVVLKLDIDLRQIQGCSTVIPEYSGSIPKNVCVACET